MATLTARADEASRRTAELENKVLQCSRSEQQKRLVIEALKRKMNSFVVKRIQEDAGRMQKNVEESGKKEPAWEKNSF